MVAGLPKPRAANDGELRRLRDAGSHCAGLAQELEALIDRDSEAYDQVVAAYRLPKETDTEKAARATAVQAALKAAVEAPLDVMRACAAAIEQSPVVAALGNASASSDVQVGRELLGAGLRGAKLNVDINLESVKDAQYVNGVRDEVSMLIRSTRM
jgi:formiminotetrahydrofolate cyclodeaminase